MLDQTEFSIEDKSYVIQQLNTTSCLEIGVAMIQIIAGAAEGIGDVPAGGGFIDTWINPGKMASGLMNKLDMTETPKLIKRVIRESMVQPEYSEEWYESEFSGELDKLVTFLEKIIALNRYGDLVKKRLPEVMGLISLVTDTEAQKSTLSSTDP